MKLLMLESYHRHINSNTFGQYTFQKICPVCLKILYLMSLKMIIKLNMNLMLERFTHEVSSSFLSNQQQFKEQKKLFLIH